mgnify:CR=1 FL=1
MTTLELKLCRAIAELMTMMMDRDPALKRPLKRVRTALVQLSEGEPNA